MNKTINKWYATTYKDDAMKDYLNGTATFTDLYNALNKGLDIYELIGVGDSLVRERLFNELALIIGVQYDVIYDLWMQPFNNRKEW